jgi:hypothetical protein
VKLLNDPNLALTDATVVLRRWTPADLGYDGLGFHLFYDQDDELKFIEAFEPCEPYYDGVRLLGEETRSVLDELTESGHEPVEDGSGYDFPHLGFGLYVPLGRIEAVSIYRRGYYDTIEPRG